MYFSLKFQPEMYFFSKTSAWNVLFFKNQPEMYFLQKKFRHFKNPDCEVCPTFKGTFSLIHSFRDFLNCFAVFECRISSGSLFHCAEVLHLKLVCDIVWLALWFGPIFKLDPYRFDLLFEKMINCGMPGVCLLYTSPSPRD